MKNLNIESPIGVTYEVTGIPDNVSRDTIEKYLASGKMCELEALGIYTYEYSRLISIPSPVVPLVSDYMEAIRLAYPGTRYHIREFISFETGESLETVESWIAGRRKMPAQAIRKLREFIKQGRQNR